LISHISLPYRLDHILHSARRSRAQPVATVGAGVSVLPGRVTADKISHIDTVISHIDTVIVWSSSISILSSSMSILSYYVRFHIVTVILSSMTISYLVTLLPGVPAGVLRRAARQRRHGRAGPPPGPDPGTLRSLQKPGRGVNVNKHSNDVVSTPAPAPAPPPPYHHHPPPPPPFPHPPPPLPPRVCTSSHPAATSCRLVQYRSNSCCQ